MGLCHQGHKNKAPSPQAPPVAMPSSAQPGRCCSGDTSGSRQLLSPEIPIHGLATSD